MTATAKQLIEKYGYSRGSVVFQIIQYISDDVARDPARYQPIDEDQNKWGRMGFSTRTPPRDFVVAISLNAALYKCYFIDDFFEEQDGNQVRRLLGLFDVSVKPPQTDYAENLCWVFKQRAMMEGGITVEPITKASIRSGIQPYRVYGGLGMRTMDKYREPDLEEAIRALLKRHRKNRRPHLEAIFRHIANGGDAIAPQIQAGGLVSEATDCDIKEIVEGWPKAKRAGKAAGKTTRRIREEYVNFVNYSESTITRFNRLYKERGLKYLADC